eukprot:4754801-Prymnesium_polylepis.1
MGQLRQDFQLAVGPRPALPHPHRREAVGLPGACEILISPPRACAPDGARCVLSARAQVEDCGKGFVDRALLARHERTHSKERPFLCPHPGCDKAFKVQKPHARARAHTICSCCLRNGCWRSMLHRRTAGVRSAHPARVRVPPCRAGAQAPRVPPAAAQPARRLLVPGRRLPQKLLQPVVAADPPATRTREPGVGVDDGEAAAHDARERGAGARDGAHRAADGAAASDDEPGRRARGAQAGARARAQAAPAAARARRAARAAARAAAAAAAAAT